MASIFPDQRGPNLTDPAPADATGVYLDLHSYGQLVLWPWGFTSTAPAQRHGTADAGAQVGLLQQLHAAAGHRPLRHRRHHRRLCLRHLGVAAYTSRWAPPSSSPAPTSTSTMLPDQPARADLRRQGRPHALHDAGRPGRAQPGALPPADVPAAPGDADRHASTTRATTTPMAPSRRRTSPPPSTTSTPRPGSAGASPTPWRPPTAASTPRPRA